MSENQKLFCSKCSKERKLLFIQPPVCVDCFSLEEYFGGNAEDVKEAILSKEVICGKHNKSKNFWKQGKSGKLESYCFSCDYEEWRNSLEYLNLNPLEIAKFFYEKGADIWPVIQKLIYISYLKALEQKKVLFEEKFEIWEGSPFLLSIFEKSTRDIYPLTPPTVLKSVKKPTQDFLIELLTDVYQNYNNEEQERTLILTLKKENKKEIGLEEIYYWERSEKENPYRNYAS